MNNRAASWMECEADQNRDRKSGRAVFTEDGRSSWEWQTATGVFTQTITDDQLANLQATELQLVEALPQVEPPEWMSVSESMARLSVARTVDSAVARQSRNRSRNESGGAVKALLRRLLGSH